MRLSAFANVRFIEARAVGLDLATRRIHLAGRPSIAFDAASLNVGISPDSQIPGVAAHTTPIKPIGQLLDRIDHVLRIASSISTPTSSSDGSSATRHRCVVVGGGAGGVEVALALQHRLGPRGETSLVTRGRLLRDFPDSVRISALRSLVSAGVVVHEHAPVTSVSPQRLMVDDGRTEIDFDTCLWCTEASAPTWLSQVGCNTTKDGFIAIRDTLQSTTHPYLFAVGDCATSVDYPRPKAGVFAVRQGPPLAENLRRYFADIPLKPFKPQSTYLSLISLGRKSCIAAWGPFSFVGDFLWRWKDRIDRAFMRKFSDDLRFDQTPSMIKEVNLDKDSMPVMRCNGCGSKISASALSTALARARADGDGDVLTHDLVEDAALVKLPMGTERLVQTVDFFRSPVADPYLFGKIAAVQALSDIHALGANPLSCLAHCTIELASEKQMSEDLYQMLRGAAAVFRTENCELVGGHTTEGPESVLGFSITGTVSPKQRTKGLLVKGHALILTKAIGTGIALAGVPKGLVGARTIQEAVRQMQQSNGEASQILTHHGVASCTDVTGFGLLGHLAEMLDQSNDCGARLGMSRTITIYFSQDYHY